MTTRLSQSPLLFLACLIWSVPAWSAPAPLEAEQVKSAIILNIARYVDWPAESFTGENGALVLCSLGRGKLSSAIKSLQGKTVKGHPVTVRQMSSAGDLAGCHVVVVGAEDRHQVAALLERSRRQPILTIGDLEGFSREGGVTELFLQDGKVRFEINLAAARQNRLKFSSQLLKVARITRGED